MEKRKKIKSFNTNIALTERGKEPDSSNSSSPSRRVHSGYTKWDTESPYKFGNILSERTKPLQRSTTDKVYPEKFAFKHY